MSATFDQPTNPGAATASAPGACERTFPTGDHARLLLENPRGRVRVTGWDRPEVQVNALKRRDASGARYQATQIELTQEGNTVVIRTVLDPSAALAERGSLSGVAAEIVRAFADLLPTNIATTSIDYDVRVPFASELDLKGVSADIAAEGTRGAYRIRTVSGTIDVNNVKGDADLGSVSGEIDGRGLSGRVHVDSVSGDVLLMGDVAALHAKMVSGDLKLTGPLSQNGEYDLKSVSGAVTLQVPASTGATVTVRGVSPDVHSDLPYSVSRNVRGPGHREWQGQVGKGGAVIRFHTVSGDLRIRELAASGAAEAAVAAIPPRTSDEVMEPLTIAEPAATSEPMPSDDTTLAAAVSSEPEAGDEMRILSALERGELSVDEALRQLEALRARSA